MPRFEIRTARYNGRRLVFQAHCATFADCVQIALRHNTSLTDAVLAGANLAGVDFTGAVMHGADLSFANLTGARFVGTGLSHANLSRVRASRANFTEADLRNAECEGAYFVGAKFCRANCSGMVALNAEFINADIVTAQFEQARLYGASLAAAKCWASQFSVDQLQHYCDQLCLLLSRERSLLQPLETLLQRVKTTGEMPEPFREFLTAACPGYALLWGRTWRATECYGHILQWGERLHALDLSPETERSASAARMLDWLREWQVLHYGQNRVAAGVHTQRRLHLERKE